MKDLNMHLVMEQLLANLFPSVQKMDMQNQAGWKQILVVLMVWSGFVFSFTSLHNSGMISEADAAVSAAYNSEVAGDHPINLFELRNTLQVS